MNNTKQIWAHEFEYEEGEFYSPSDYGDLPRDIFSTTEFIVYDISDNTIYWHKEKNMVTLSRDYSKEHYPALYKRFKHHKYD